MAGESKSKEKKNLKLITLYREAVHQVEPNDECRGTDEHRRLTLTMDYFDALEVKEDFSDDDKIREFFGQNMDEELNDYDVAMHSIPIYCPENEITQSAADNDPFYGDPFQERQEAGYLCLIQVYITPEVLRRVDVYKSAKESKPEAAAKVYDCFFKDLHEAMREYTSNNFYEVMEDGSRKCTEEGFCYSIYQSLSIGDFMIGIRSRSLDCVFRIVRAIRRRKFVDIYDKGTIAGENDPKSLILYKTYTIVSISNMVIPEENDRAKTLDRGNRFILRAVLSNHYWDDEKKIEKRFPPDLYLYSSEFKWLHGRYNFSVELSEKAFLRLLPTIKKCKLNQIEVDNKKVDLTGREEKICGFLEFLLEKGYISHLNERYVAGNVSGIKKMEQEQDGIIKPFCDLRTERGYFNDAINECLRDLKDNIQRKSRSIRQLNTSRASLSYNARLLKRLANTCSAINGYSDSRVYAVIIIQLIKAVLNGTEDYLNVYAGEKDLGIIRQMDDELNGAITDLNEFSKYILDNSMQSIQAPDFNLESHTSVEKLMMSYSAFLQNMIDWFASTDFAKSIGGLREKYVTVMVPKAVDNGISIKAYYYRLNEIISENEGAEKLLAVHCPSFYTLTDFAGSIGRLLHELAHNLRYESREERNEFIIRYSAGLLFDQLGVDMMERLRTEIESLKETVKVQEMLEECFSKSFISTYLKSTYLKLHIPNYKAMKLLNLTGAIRRCYIELVKAVSYLGSLRNCIIKFVRSEDYRILDDENIQKLWNFYKRFFDETADAEECARSQEETRKELFSLLEKALYRNTKNIANQESLEYARSLFDLLGNGVPDENAERFFCVCIGAASFIKALTESVSDKVDQFQNTPDGRKIARHLAMGYYYASDSSSIDFMDNMRISIHRTQTESLELWERNIYLYREVASDLFMAKVLGLTQFGYLNYCSKYIPVEGEIDDNYSARMALTIYAMNGTKDSSDRESQFNVWKEMFHSLCKYLGMEINGVADKVTAELSAPVKDFVQGMKNYASRPVNNEVKMLQLVEKTGIVLARFGEKTDEKHTFDVLMHCSFLCRNFLKVCGSYFSYFGKLSWSAALAEDLAKGGEALGKLHEELKDTYLWRYCCMIRDSFNEPESVDSAWRSVFSAEEMNEFVLNMHYDMLFRNIDKFNRHKDGFVIE